MKLATGLQLFGSGLFVLSFFLDDDYKKGVRSFGVSTFLFGWGMKIGAVSAGK